MSRQREWVVYVLLASGLIFVSHYFYLVIDKAFWVDEAHMLMAARHPDYYAAIVSLFGFVLHPIYRISSFDLTVYKLLGLGILLASAVMFSSTVCRLLLKRFPRQQGGSLTERTVFFVVSFSALYYSVQWNGWNGLIPSYNYLNLIGLLILWTGLIRQLAREELEWETTAFLCISLGFFLVFCAKPTTALLMAILMMSGLPLVATSIRRAIVYCSAFVAAEVLMFAGVSYIYFGDSYSLLAVLYRGVVFEQYISHDVSGMIHMVEKGYREFSAHFFPSSIVEPGWSPIVLPLIAIAGIVGTQATSVRMSQSSWVVVGIFAVLVAILQVKRLVDIHETADTWRTDVFFKFELIWVSLVVSVFSFWSQRIKFVMNRKQIVSVIGLGVTSFIYAFGTNTSLVKLSSGAMIFTVAAMLVLLSRSLEERVAQRAVVALSVVAILMLPVTARLSLRVDWPTDYEEATYQVSQMNGGNSVFVEKEDGRFFDAFLLAARTGKMKSGEAVLNIGGRKSVKVSQLIYLLNAKSFPHPSFNYTYERYDRMVKKSIALSQPKSRACIWLLIAEDQRSTFGKFLGKEFGFPSRYKKLRHLDGVELWKPVRNVGDGERCA